MPNSYFTTRETCPSCASSNQEVLYSCGFDESPIREYLRQYYTRGERIDFEYLAGARYTVVECQTCGLVFQQEIGGDFVLQKLYEEWIDPDKIHDPGEQESKFDYALQYAQEVMLLLSYFRKPSSELKFFDFGMGWGRWCMMVKAFGCQAYGAELSPTRIAYARAHGVRVIDWENIPEYQFEVINTEQVFEHLAQPLETLLHLKRALKPQGLIKISVPDGSQIKRRLEVMDWSAPKRHRNSLNPIHPLEHINCFKAKSLLNLAKQARLKPVIIPLRLQYRSATGWEPVKPLVSNLLKPIYRKFFPRPTYGFFTQDA